MAARWRNPSAIMSLAADLPMSMPQVSAGSKSASRKPCACSMRKRLISLARFMLLNFHGFLPLGKVRVSLVIAARDVDLAAEHPIRMGRVADDDRHQDE